MLYIIEMQEDDETVGEEVNKVNAEFYHAFESLSIEMMRHKNNTFCTRLKFVNYFFSLGLELLFINTAAKILATISVSLIYA
jgi:hypothetical protein